MQSEAQGAIGPRLSHNQLRWHLLPIAILTSLALTIYGFAHSDILASTPWSPTMTYQVGLLGLVVISAVAVAFAVERRWKFRFEVSLAGFGVVATIASFGLSPVILVATFLLSATLIGTWLSLRLPGANRLPGAKSSPFVFVTVFGAAVFGIVFTLIAPMPINTPTLHSLVLVAPFAFALFCSRTRLALRVRADALIKQAQSVGDRTVVEVLGTTAFLLVALLHLLLSALPERYFDAMVMHLYVPSYVAAHRAWSFDAALYAWAFMPGLTDWLYTHFFLLGGEAASRLYNLAALILVCAVLYACAVRVASREAAIWVAALFVSMPIAFIESSSLFVETTLALWITSAVALICVADLRPDAPVTVMALTLLAAATMSKLHGAIAAVVIGPVLLGLFLRGRPPKRDVTQVLALSAVVTAVGCFPYAYSWLRTGNPIFPFYNDVFESPFFSANRFHDTRWEGNLNWSLLYDATFASTRFGEVATGALGLTMILVVPLAVAAMIARRDGRAVVCFSTAIAFALVVGSQIQYLRYFYPVFPLLLVPGAMGLALLFEQRLTRLPTLALVVAATIFNVYKLPAGGWILSNFDLRGGFDLTARRNIELAQAPERVANELINDAVGGTARVLYMSNPYGGLLQGQALYPNWYNMRLADDLREVVTPEQAEGLLARWAVTHVVTTANATDSGPKALDAYLKANYCPLAEIGPLSVYDLRKTRSKTP